jgi:hypothetical protein
MTEHTPGPWEYTDAGHAKYGEPYKIDEYFVRRPDDDVAIASTILDPDTCEPSESNARLISAAPYLLAACEAEEKAETLRDYHERLMMTPISRLGDADRLRDSFAAWKDQVLVARELRKSAIAKARGEVTP